MHIISRKMKESRFEWSYSKGADIFRVFLRDTKITGSAEVGDFTIDFLDKEVVGLEIMQASEFFTTIGISKEALSQISDTKIWVDKRNPSSYVLYLTILPQGSPEKVIPVPAPIRAMSAGKNLL